MSNNRIQKNVIQNTESINVLQYQQPDNIQYTDGHVTAVRVNNSFNQLVENDIFNENALNWISACCPGPKRYDETDFDTAINGYKTWRKLPDEDLAIVHKVEQDLSSSLVVQQIPGLQSDPNYVGQAFGNVTVCTGTGLYMLIENAYTKISDIACNSVYSDSFISLIAADDGLYQIIQNRTGKVFAYSLAKRYDSVSPIRSVYANRQNNVILIGNSDGNVFFAKYNADANVRLEFEKSYVFSGNVETEMTMNGCTQIRHNSMRDGRNDMILYGKNGICQSRYVKFVSSPAVYALNKNCTACSLINGKLYTGTTAGLYENDMLIQSTAGLNISHMTRYAQFLYVSAGSKLIKFNAVSGKAETINLAGEIKDIFIHQQDDKTVCCVRLTDNRIYAIDESNWLAEISPIYEAGVMSYADNTLFFANNGKLSVFGVTAAYNKNNSITAFSDYPYKNVSYAGKSVLDVFEFNSGEYVITNRAIYSGENTIYDFNNVTECTASKFGTGDIDMLFVDNGKVQAINQLFETPSGFPATNGVTHVGETTGCVLAASRNVISCIQKAQPHNVRTVQYGGNVSQIIGFGDGTGAYVLNAGKISAAYEINVAATVDCDMTVACDASQLQLSTGNDAFIFARSDGSNMQVSGWFLSSDEDYAGVCSEQYPYAGISSIDIDGNVIYAYGPDGIHTVYYTPDYENSTIQFKPAHIVMPDGVRRMKKFGKYTIFADDSGISATDIGTGVTFPISGAPTAACKRLERSFKHAYALFDDANKTLMRLDFEGDLCSCVKILENVIDVRSDEYHVNAITESRKYYKDIEDPQNAMSFVSDSETAVKNILPEIDSQFARIISESIGASNIQNGITQIMFSDGKMLYFTVGNQTAESGRIENVSGYANVKIMRKSPDFVNGILFSNGRTIYQMTDEFSAPSWVYSASADIQDFIVSQSRIYAKYSGKWHIIENGVALDISGDAGFSLNGVFDADGTQIMLTTDGMKKGMTYSRLTIKQNSLAIYDNFDINPQTMIFTTAQNAVAIMQNAGGKRTVYAIMVNGGNLSHQQLAFKLNGVEKTEFDDFAFADIYCKTFACRIGNAYYFCADMRTLSEYTDFRLPQNGPLKCAACEYGQLYAVGTNAGMYSSSGNAYSYVFDKISASGLENAEIVGMSEIDDGKYVIGGSEGLYLMTDGEGDLSDLIYKSNRISTPVSSMTAWDADGTRIAAISTNKTILTSDDGKTWSDFLYPCLGCSLDGCDASQIFMNNRSEYWLIDECGLERTQPGYQLVNDIHRFTIDDAVSAYMQLSSDFEERYSQSLAQHIDEYHSYDSAISFANENCLSTSMDGLNDEVFGNIFIDSPAFTVAKSSADIVFEFMYGDQETGDVNISLSNFLTSQTDGNVNYILRRYMSGISELYVYVPTTNTYYLSHVRGSPACSFENAQVYRPNLSRFGAKTASETAANPVKCYSTFDIGIDDSLLSIDTVIDVQSVGNSLPLGVYVEDPDIAKGENYASKMYHSAILPTVCMTDTTKIQPSADNMYHFRFACFGSDAQAVCIRFIDTTNRGGSNRFTIVFDSNGGSGKMGNQNVIIGQSRKIRRNKFVYEKTSKKSGKTFCGWSKTRRSDTAIDYCDEQEILLTSSEISPGEQITLYAVWAPYEFSSDVTSFNDTVLQIADTSDELYINGADIISSGDGEKLAVIDYGK